MSSQTNKDVSKRVFSSKNASISPLAPQQHDIDNSAKENVAVGTPSYFEDPKEFQLR